MLGLTAHEALLPERDRRWRGERELGIIAGTVPVGFGRFMGPFEAPSDGTVLVEETLYRERSSISACARRTPAWCIRPSSRVRSRHFCARGASRPKIRGRSNPIAGDGTSPNHGSRGPKIAGVEGCSARRKVGPNRSPSLYSLSRLSSVMIWALACRRAMNSRVGSNRALIRIAATLPSPFIVARVNRSPSGRRTFHRPDRVAVSG